MSAMGTQVNETEHRAKVLAEVEAERTRQDAKWGQQDHPVQRAEENYTAYDSGFARRRCDKRFAEGRGSFADILLEEVYEAIDAESEAEARKELVQVAAVAVSAIQAIDRRSGNGPAT